MTSTERRPLLVVNPRSGRGQTGRAFATMRFTIEDALGPVDVAMTTHPGHGIELARDGALAGHRLIVAVGGDGTIHEVVNGLVESGLEGDRRARLGIIGQGTGGDFRRTLGIEHRLDRYLAAISSGHERSVDVGRLRYRDRAGETRERYFVNILSAGMGGLVDQYVAEMPRVVSGKSAYFLASLRALVNSRPGRVHASVRLAGARSERTIETLMLAICNGRYFGSGMHVAPMAKPDDGVFDVVVVGGRSKVAFAASSRKVYDASHLGERGVEHFQCDGIDLTLENADAERTFLLDVDGEPLGGLPLEVDLVPAAVLVRA